MKIGISALALVALLGGCGGDSDDGAKTLVEQCVEKVVALYEKHDLPFTADPSERPAKCREFMRENDIATAADLEIQIRAADKELRDLDK